MVVVATAVVVARWCGVKLAWPGAAKEVKEHATRRAGVQRERTAMDGCRWVETAMEMREMLEMQTRME